MNGMLAASGVDDRAASGTEAPEARTGIPGRLTWVVPGDVRRLDRALADLSPAVPGLSRTRLQALIGEGRVSVDGCAVRTAHTKVSAGSVIVVDVPEAVAAGPRAQAITLAIVFEDEHLLVLDKPAGLVVHPAAGHEDGTLVNALIAHCGDSLSGIGGVRRPGIVHRIDKDTSGLLVVAKTDAAHAGLGALFADHGRTGSLERRYTAFVWGVPSTSDGVVDRPLGRHPRHRERMAVVPEGHGRRAVTRWRLAEDFGGVASKLVCRLETGRTHQIRVHLTSVGHPLVGDPVYGAGFRTKARLLSGRAAEAAGALARQALHASTLGFEHPVTGRHLSFESPLPSDLRALDEALGRV